MHQLRMTHLPESRGKRSGRFSSGCVGQLRANLLDARLECVVRLAKHVSAEQLELRKQARMHAGTDGVRKRSLQRGGQVSRQASVNLIDSLQRDIGVRMGGSIACRTSDDNAAYAC
jgi:hypothetical protein